MIYDRTVIIHMID